jgi:hypothetical protein
MMMLKQVQSNLRREHDEAEDGYTYVGVKEM